MATNPKAVQGALVDNAVASAFIPAYPRSRNKLIGIAADFSAAVTAVKDITIKKITDLVEEAGGVLGTVTLSAGSTDTDVASTAFSYVIDGTQYAKAAVAAGTALPVGVVPVDKWSLFRSTIDAAGVITLTAAADSFLEDGRAKAITLVIGVVADEEVRISEIVAAFAGVPVVVAAADAPLAAGTIPQDKWGLYRFSVASDDAVTCTAAAANFTTGYDDEAAAIAALPALPAGDVDLGHVTVLTANGQTFVGGTDALEGGSGGNPSSDTNYYGAAVSSGGYANEAAALAAIPAVPADEVSMGHVTVLTASGEPFIAGTDALQGGSSGDPSDDTNYYSTTAATLATVATLQWDFNHGSFCKCLPGPVEFDYGEGVVVELEASGTGGTSGRVTLFADTPFKP